MIVSYLKYLFKARNEYHIHSPFVYDFYKKVYKDGQSEVLDQLGMTRFLELPVDGLLDRYLLEKDEKTQYRVEGIHKNTAAEAAWNAICSHPAVVLTLDFYRYGYVFYRRGMEKQNFVLKK